jgi:anti-sigma B factor antagonist
VSVEGGGFGCLSRLEERIGRAIMQLRRLVQALLDMEHEPLTIELANGKSPDTRVIGLEGPLTISNLFDFQKELRNGTWTNTILEMLGVPYMDSAGMGAIITFYVSCQRNGRRMIVCGLNYRVIELFKLTNVDRLITIADDLDHAEAILKEK